VGFWREGEGYLIFLDRPVAYTGNDPQLARFFSQDRHFFPDFPALEEGLRALEPGLPALFHPLRRELAGSVLGQEQAVEAVAFRLSAHVCKREPTRPLSLILYGPTGVGKSLLAKQVAPALNRFFSDRYCTVWTELNTFTQPHSVYRLTGAPPGYVGYDDPPVLEEVTENPWTVFLFDELDKAHPEVLKVFMSILDEGRCTARRPGPSGSRELDFRRCVFLFTTNSPLSAPARRVGFNCATTVQAQAPLPGPGGLARRLYREDEAARWAMTAQGTLREIAGRFTGLIGFQNLTPQARRLVTARQIMALGREHGLTITGVSPAIVQALTPADAFSLRSTPAVLEGVLTPLLAQAAGRSEPLRLDGTLERMYLLPA